MSIRTEPSPSDFDRWQLLLIAGEESSTAARSLGHTSSAFRRVNSERHAECLAASREARAGAVDEQMEKWAIADDAPPAIRLAWARRWNPAYSNRVELTGANEGPVRVTVEDARAKLARKIDQLASGTVAR